MPSTGSFFPRIESVFYAVFDVLRGPKVVYQVPEGLIATESPTASTSSGLSLLSPASPQFSAADASSRKRSVSSNRSLFHFDDISKYVMPSSPLCGRLVICATSKHRIIGFPVELEGPYDRNYFRYNLCFVFERSADLSCYEPIVRKVSRVLIACEEESAFLSSPQSSHAIHAILEQLYEDLNSYSETSIPMDRFNSIELKIFPFYPNPPPVKDYMVPLALINLTKRIEPNWDLTMVKVCQYIDGTKHVSRIARLAECDLDLTRQAISHLLYYQVIMMIDIFQYSNMYTLRPSFQWLADESHVRDECGPYATKPGKAIADWPRLLYLYSRLKPGKTVLEWMEEHDVQSYGIDVRRFTSFGVIKGFLRRVHRWPILSDADTPTPQSEHLSSLGRKRGKSFAATLQALHPLPQADHDPSPGFDPLRGRARPQEPQPTVASAGAELLASPPAATALPKVPARRASAAETSLEQLRTRRPRRSANDVFYPPSSPSPAVASGGITKGAPESGYGGGSGTLGLLRPRLERSPSMPVLTQVHAQVGPTYPRELLPLLDGEHNTDEICTQFEVGWPVLRQWLVLAGDGKGDEDFGRVSIIYR